MKGKPTKELASLKRLEARAAEEMRRRQQAEAKERKLRKMPLSYKDPRLDDPGALEL